VSNTKTIRVPSKTFIFGEYSALVNGPALLVTTEPFFEIHIKKRNQAIHPTPYFLHPYSPAGRYLAQLKQDEIWDIESIKFDFPIGGLGQSSAEFIAVYEANQQTQLDSYLMQESQDADLSAATQKQQKVDPLLMRETFRNLFASHGQTPPSGYDVVAQAYQGFIAFHPEKRKLMREPLWPLSQFSFFLVGTGNKLKTHKHLTETNLKQKGEVLIPLAQDCYEAWIKKECSAFLEAIKNFRHGLQALGLEHAQTTRFIERFESITGFLGAKGCGAMGQDFFMIFFETYAKSNFLQQVRRFSDLTVLTDETRLRT
jgi:mevalonate kinase